MVSDDIVTRPCCDVRPCGCADARMVIDHLHAEIERLNLVMVHLDKVCNLLVAELLRNSDYRAYTTTTLLQEFVYRAVRGE